ncbi:helix-turn-helix domain-containing protein [Desulfosporosinus orientis]
MEGIYLAAKTLGITRNVLYEKLKNIIFLNQYK